MSMNLASIKSQISTREWQTYLLLFGISLILRLVYFIIMLTQTGPSGLYDQFNDPVKYINAADYLLGRYQPGQYELFLVGIGYPAILAVSRILMGQSFLAVIILQILLSSMSSIIVYKIADLLTGNRAVAVVSGTLVATSLTSISLANALVTESIYFFLFSLSVYLFFRCLDENNWRNAVLSGVSGGCAVLLRSAGGFFPAILILSALLVPAPAGRRRQLIYRSLVVSMIMVAIPVFWGVRNLLTHDTFTVSATGTLAAKTYLVAKVKIEEEGRHIREFPELRDSLYRVSLKHFHEGNFRLSQEESKALIAATARKYPVTMLRNFFQMVLENMTAVSSLHYLQLPRWRPFFETIDHYWNRGDTNPAMLTLSLIGFVLIARRNMRIAVVLLLGMGYYGIISGVTFGQGSRIFYPAQGVEFILAATALVFIYRLISMAARKLSGRLATNR